jgi:hypothetical protein
MLKKVMLLSSLMIVTLFLAGCDGDRGFSKKDVKNKFCGVRFDARYCKCAFHNEHCDQIRMSQGEAKDHVYEKYAEWLDGGIEKEKEECKEKNGWFLGNSCYLCKSDEVALDNKCVPADEVEGTEKEEEKGECKFDSDCDAICEGDIMWKMGCNPRENACEKTFDTDCSANQEEFGELSFSQLCQGGECVRNNEAIDAKKAELTSEQKKWSDQLKAINAGRDDLTWLMLDTHKDCINGIADMTNVVIMEFATRVSAVIAGGAPDAAGAAVDYVGEGLNRLFAYSDGEVPTGEEALKPHEYIKLNCDLYNYFKSELSGSDAGVDEAVENARKAKEQLDALP